MKADFDIAAKNYDNHFTYSEIGKMQRNLVYKNVAKQLKNCTKILEVNCGTGEDAVWLAKQKFQVTATDISEEMIKVAQTKITTGNLNFKVLNLTNISQLNESFEVIFSNFGGFNCLHKPELVGFFNSATKTLSKNGKVILVIMPKNTLWEQFYFLCKWDKKNAFRRKKEVVFANVDGEKVATYYYNPKEIVLLAGTNFKVVTVKPIGFFVPPSYLEPFFKNKKWLLKGLHFLENRIKNWSLLAKFADHYIITFQKQ